MGSCHSGWTLFKRNPPPWFKPMACHFVYIYSLSTLALLPSVVLSHHCVSAISPFVGAVIQAALIESNLVGSGSCCNIQKK